MEVKPIDDGYMKTVAGVIPNDWTVRHMGGIARVVSGQVDPRMEPFSLMPLVAPDHIESGTGRLARSIPTAREQQAISGKYLFRSGTVIYSKIRPHLRKVCIAPFDGLCSADMYPLLPADDVHPGFLFASLLSERFSKYAESVSIRSGMPKINREELASFEFVLPSTRQEQTQIAETLADADKLIDSLEQLLAKKRQIKQGAMQELLTGQRRLPGFEAAWTDGVLEDVVAELVAGVSVNSDPTGASDGVPSVVKTSALKGGFFDASECKPIVQADLGRAATPLRQDTLLISRMNTPDLVGEVGYVDRAYDWLYLPDRIWMTRMRSPDCVCVRWLGYLLSSAPYKRLIGDTATGTSGSMKNIAKSALLGLPLRFPEVDEQRAIAAGLAVMDAEITALESRLTKARALKQAMAQALLTGRIRLVEPTA